MDISLFNLTNLYNCTSIGAKKPSLTVINDHYLCDFLTCFYFSKCHCCCFQKQFMMNGVGNLLKFHTHMFWKQDHNGNEISNLHKSLFPSLEIYTLWCPIGEKLPFLKHFLHQPKKWHQRINTAWKCKTKAPSQTEWWSQSTQNRQEHAQLNHQRIPQRKLSHTHVLESHKLQDHNHHH